MFATSGAPEVPARRPAAGPPAPRDIQRRAHLITLAIVGGVVAFIWIVWSKPILLLFLLLGVVLVMAYAAVYLLVSARLTEDEELEPEATGAGADAPEPDDEEAP